MRSTKSHKYMGLEIVPVISADMERQGYRWYIQAYHHATGIPFSHDCCAHYRSLAAAREAIKWDEMRRGCANA